MNADDLAVGLDGVAFGCVATDKLGHVYFANTAFCRLTGHFSPAALIGRAFSAMFGDSTAPDALTPGDTLSTRLTPADVPEVNLHWTRNPAGGWLGTTIVPPTPDAVSSAGPDPITGLGQRKHFLDGFDTARQRRSWQRMVVMTLDLDHFRAANHTLGHDVSAELLRKAAERLENLVRDGDTLAQIGSSEFAILVLEDAHESVANDLSVQIIDLLSRPYIIHGNQVNLSVSIGLAAVEDGAFDGNEYLRRAGIALYHSRNLGRHRAQWFEHKMAETLSARRQLEIDMRRAILLRQLELRFQPLKNLVDGSVHAIKTWVQWRHPKLGVIPQSSLISVAEQTGEIISIGNWALNEACKAAVTWGRGVRLSIPITPTRFRDQNFVPSVRAALDLSGLPPEQLELELTETVLLRNEDVARQKMTALRNLGASLSLNEFGTGLLSMNYLHSLPFDNVKFDQSVVEKHITDESALQIVTAIANLGSALGMQLYAEGVNSTEQIDSLHKRGCISVQGLTLAPPMSEHDAAVFVSDLLKDAS